MKNILLLAGLIFVFTASYAKESPDREQSQTTAIPGDTAAISSTSAETKDIIPPDDKPENSNKNAPARDLTLEKVDYIMAQLVSKLPKEQRETIRKSNGEMYEYIPPASLKKSKKVRKRKIVEINSVKDLSSLYEVEDEDGNVPTRHYRIYEYNNGQTKSVTDDNKDISNILSYLDALDNEGGYSDSYGSSKNFLEHFSLGVGVSTTGFRLDYGATISPNVDFRLGFSYLDFNRNITVGVEDDLIRGATAGGYDPDLDFEAEMKFYNLHTMFDFYPMRNGIFHLTAGLFFGKNEISVDGSLIDPQTGEKAILAPEYEQWPNLHFADYEIPVRSDGNVKADIRTGKDWVKPYLGVGLGRSVPKGNFSFKLEAGLMYQGSYSIESNGTELRKAKNRSDSFDSNYKKLMEWWPVINLQLVYRFK